MRVRSVQQPWASELDCQSTCGVVYASNVVDRMGFWPRPRGPGCIEPPGGARCASQWMAMLLAAGCVLQPPRKVKTASRPWRSTPASGHGHHRPARLRADHQGICRKRASSSSPQPLHLPPHRKRPDVDDDTNKVDGEWYEVDDVIFDPSGARTERSSTPRNTLQRVMMSPSDFRTSSTDTLRPYRRGHRQYDVNTSAARRSMKSTASSSMSAQIIEKKNATCSAASGSTQPICSCSHRRPHGPDDTARTVKTSIRLHDLARQVDGTTGSGLHQGRGVLHFQVATATCQRRPHPRHHQVFRLQAVRINQQNHLQRPGHHPPRPNTRPNSSVAKEPKKVARSPDRCTATSTSARIHLPSVVPQTPQKSLGFSPEDVLVASRLIPAPRR